MAVLYTKEDYWIVAGPKNTVEDVIGASAAIALQEFRTEYVDNEKWPPQMRAFFQTVVTSCEGD